MQMIEINNADMDWLMIRQALSFALLKNRTVVIPRGRAFLQENPRYRHLFEDMVRSAADIGAGKIAFDGESIIYEPLPIVSGVYSMESASFSSSVELLLFLMPGLFFRDFRSIINLKGVTHSVLSYPTAFIKECLLKALERLGFYSSLTLKRFGFYGSGGGMFESRVYPRESNGARIFSGHTHSLSGATIYISHLNADFAMQEKRFLAESLELDQDKIAIIEVVDSDGPGNSIQVYTNYNSMDIVLFREVQIYNESGVMTFKEDDLVPILSDLSGEFNALIRGGVLPDYIFRELYPYFILSGAECEFNGNTKPAAMTKNLVDKFLQ